MLRKSLATKRIHSQTMTSKSWLEDYEPTEAEKIAVKLAQGGFRGRVISWIAKPELKEKNELPDNPSPEQDESFKNE